MTEQQAGPQPADAQNQRQQGQPGQQPPPPQGQYGSYQHYQGPYAPPRYRRLTRTSWDAPVSGVCGGLARYFGVDPTLIRILTVIGVVVTFPVGLVAYVVAWAVIPKE